MEKTNRWLIWRNLITQIIIKFSTDIDPIFLRDAIFFYLKSGYNYIPNSQIEESFFTFIKPSSSFLFAKPTCGIQFGKLTGSINSIKIQQFSSFVDPVKEKYFLIPRRSEPVLSELPKWRGEFVISVDYQWIQLEATGSRTYRNTEIVQGILDQSRLDLRFNWSIKWHTISGLSPIIKFWSPQIFMFPCNQYPKFFFMC